MLAMGRITIAVYRPKKGEAQKLHQLVTRHLDVLRAEGLVTDRRPIVMESRDGTIVEIFEWKSGEAIQAAHNNPKVGELWAAFSAVCEYLAPVAVDEFHNMFSEFEPVN